MTLLRREELLPNILSVVYWHQRDHFFYDQDITTAWTLLAVESGSCNYGIGEQEGIAKSGDVILCSPQTLFKRKVLTTLSFYYFNLNWDILLGNSPVINRKLFEEQLHTVLPIGKITIRDVQRLSSHYEYFKRLCGDNHPTPNYHKNLLLQDIWLMYCNEAESVDHIARNISDNFMERAMERLKEYAFTPFNLKQLSSELSLTAVQFTRRFQAYCGMTPKDYLCSLRMEKAKQMLQKTDLPIAQIAFECGYDNGLYFCRVFSRKIKQSPSQYRLDHRI